MKLPRVLVLTVNRQIQRFDDTAKHLDEQGITWERFEGFDNKICKLRAVETFDFDRAGDHLDVKHVAATLTHWAAWKVMSYQPDESFVALEFDVRFVDGWQDKFDEIVSSLPDDWDMVYLGNCCCKGRETYEVVKDGITSKILFDVRYPLCGHAIWYRKKCLETLLMMHQKIDMPLDIAMYKLSLPMLRVYSVIPPIITQHNTFLPP